MPLRNRQKLSTSHNQSHQSVVHGPSGGTAMANSNADMASAFDCLDSVSALREEISVAIACISRDALGEFELSLWRQEMLCARIKREIGSTRLPRGSEEARQRVQEMCTALKRQSEIYSAVMHKCSRSRAILSDLCHLYGYSRQQSGSPNSSPLCCEA